MYCVTGVDGLGVTLGSRPMRALWEGVRGISVRLSWVLNSGSIAIAILYTGSEYTRKSLVLK